MSPAEEERAPSFTVTYWTHKRRFGRAFWQHFANSPASALSLVMMTRVLLLCVVDKKDLNGCVYVHGKAEWERGGGLAG